MTTLVGEIIGAHSDFHIIHEPTKHQSTFSHQTIPTDSWYDYFDDLQSEQLADRLKRIQFGTKPIRQLSHKLKEIKNSKDIARLYKFTMTNFKHARTKKKAVFKDPFMCLSAKTLQENYGVNVIITMRHPCGFAESLSRRGSGFDFQNLIQPNLLEIMPEFKNDIEKYSAEVQPITFQAALLWKIVYSFAEKFYLDNSRTIVIHQEDLVSNPGKKVDLMLAAIGVNRSKAVDDVMERSFSPTNPIDFANTEHSYTDRNLKMATEKWRDRMAPGDIDDVMKIVGEIAGRFGYY